MHKGTRNHRLALATVLALALSAPAAVASAGASAAPAARPMYGVWNAVAAGAADDVWAVGRQGFRRHAAASIADHWDGSSWTEMKVAGNGTELSDVSVLPSGQAWAVGFNDRLGTQLIEYWDGTSWTQQRSAAATGKLYSVSALSPTDVWAVGSVGDTPRPFAEHWDGTRWTRVSTPVDGLDFDALTGVSMLAADDGWAVGYLGGKKALILHWDGSSWTQVSAPKSAGDVYPNSVDAASATDAWLVGPATAGNYPALTQHWNGTRWIRVKGPDLGFEPTLNDVNSLSPSDTWVVGYAQRQFHGGITYETLAAHWDGSDWSVVDTPNPDPRGGDALDGVAVVSADDAWAVGDAEAFVDAHSPLIMHWDGETWSVVP